MARQRNDAVSAATTAAVAASSTTSGKVKFKIRLKLDNK